MDVLGARRWRSFPSGRIDALAVAPGIPSIDEQEKRDRVPPGTYQRLVDAGLLRTADGLRVPPPAPAMGGDRGSNGDGQTISSLTVSALTNSKTL